MKNWTSKLLTEARSKGVYGEDSKSTTHILYRGYYLTDDRTFGTVLFVSEIVRDDELSLDTEGDEELTREEALSKLHDESPHNVEILGVQPASEDTLSKREALRKYR